MRIKQRASKEQRQSEERDDEWPGAKEHWERDIKRKRRRPTEEKIKQECEQVTASWSSIVEL